MKPWLQLDACKAPDGTLITLWQHDQEFVIRAGNIDLMGSRQHGSEEALAALGLAHLVQQKTPVSVLVGGLGMGFTLIESLKRLPMHAKVEVAELLPAIVIWNERYFHRADASTNPLADARTQVLTRDVRELMQTQAQYDAILLDVDNGPSALVNGGNDGLYSLTGIRRAKNALKPGGVLAVWSAGEDEAFRKRLNQTGFHAETHRVRARGRAGQKHVIWLAR